MGSGGLERERETDFHRVESRREGGNPVTFLGLLGRDEPSFPEPDGDPEVSAWGPWTI